jgi:hypothetical protein
MSDIISRSYTEAGRENYGKIRWNEVRCEVCGAVVVDIGLEKDLCLRCFSEGENDTEI